MDKVLNVQPRRAHCSACTTWKGESF